MAALPLRNRLAAEALGTGLLVATVVGSGLMATSLTGDVGLALLANMVATAAVLIVLISILGPVSGAHFNPAVTLVLALRRETAAGAALLYVAAQALGGVLGTLLAHGMFSEPLLQASQTVRTGTAQWLSEGVATFGLLLTILLGRQARPEAVPLLVALWIAAAYWATASTSFANPAVSLARAFSDSFAGIRPWDLPGFWLSQVAGALLAAAAAPLLLPPKD
jgi:glycerol uptake facilitator-like aquaporin